MGYERIALYLLAINAFTFYVYWADKRYARKNMRRVSEKTLLRLALFGGSPMAFIAQRKFRHKTNKTSFRRRFFLVIAVQLVVCGYFFYQLLLAA